MSTVRVPSVKKEIHVFKSGHLVVVAYGVVPTTSWSNAELAPWYYIAPPADGVLDLDFTAQTPDTYVIEVESLIEATCVIPNAQDFWGKGKPLAGIRIHATSNTLESDLVDKDNLKARQMFILAEGMPLPWPWPWPW